MRVSITALLAVMAISAPALAGEAYRCADTKTVGLVWNEKLAIPGGELTNFVPNSYVVTVVSKTKRTVADATGAYKDDPLKLTCRTVADPRFPDLLTCRDSGGLYVWAFNGPHYTRASIFGPPLRTQVHNNNLVVAHGTCAKP